MADRAIIFGITTDHAFAAGTLLASILAQDPGFDADVVILHDGLPADQQAAFLRLWPRCRFRSFTLADVLERLGVDGDSAKLQPILARFSPLVFAKLEIPALLDDYVRVLWMDADILVRGPLTQAWDFDCIAWRTLPQGAFARRQKVFAAFPNLVRDLSVPLLNGGVIGVGRGFLKAGGSAGALYAMARELLGQTNTTQVVELAWHLVAATIPLSVTALPLSLNHPITAPGVSDAVAIHAIGPHKFWNVTPLLHLYPDWRVHQATWVASGGTPYSGAITMTEVCPVDPWDVMRAAEMRAYWLKTFGALRAVLPRGMVVDLQHDPKGLRILLHGRPETQFLRLIRLPNARRIGLEAHLPAPLDVAVLVAVGQAVQGTRDEKGAMLSLPGMHIGAALTAADAAIPRV